MDNKRLARIALVALLALGCVLILEPFIAAILFAAVICITTWPLYAWLLVRLKGRAWLAALLMTLLLTLVVLLPMSLLAVSLAEVTPGLIEKIRALEKAQVAPPEWLRSIPLAGDQIEAYWRQLVESREELNALLRQLYDPTRRFLLKAASLVGEGLLQLLLVLFIAFFFYRDGSLLAERLRVLGRRLSGELGEQMVMLAHSTINSVMIGIVGTAAGQALVALIGFLLAGVPGAMLLAAVTFFLSMIPIGPPLVWGGAAYWLYEQGEIGWAIFMVVWGVFAISSVDNFLKPFLISRTASLPILLIAIGVFGGALAFGFVGIFLGPTLLALALVLVDKWTSAKPPLESRKAHSPETVE
ncbi:MAG: AI-2E family transporter [Betaproteobacteria bacterium RIFCSPLOWO2_12_FULL_66_14]|nr:MAG: AI-2E family transporter [Betaproteobacteria bacterium RIFCSPLOWO2_12_FULL_66_14]